MIFGLRGAGSAGRAGLCGGRAGPTELGWAGLGWSWPRGLGVGLGSVLVRGFERKRFAFCFYFHSFERNVLFVLILHAVGEWAEFWAGLCSGAGSGQVPRERNRDTWREY